MALTEKQKELRRTAVGASEIAALAGLSRWSSPIRIYEAKRTGLEIDANLSMELGNLLEEPIATIYRGRTKKLTAPVDTLRHPERPFAVATPDRGVFATATELTLENGVLQRGQLQEAERLLQIKSTTWRMAHEWGTPGSDEVPEDYLAQVQWEMGVAGLSVCDLGVLFDKDRFEIFTVHFRAELFDALYSIAERFMVDHVLAGKPPPPDASDAYAEYLGRAFTKEQTKDLLPSPPELEASLRTFALLKTFEKAIKGALKYHRNAICAAVGDATGLRGDWGSLTWKKSRDSVGTDWQAAAVNLSNLAGMLLMKFGAQLPAEEREELERQIRGAATLNVKVKPGSRRLLPKWDPAFAATLPGVLDLAPLLELGAGDTTTTDEE